jgi:hypothetical protein
VIYLACSNRYDGLADSVVELPGPIEVEPPDTAGRAGETGSGKDGAGTDGVAARINEATAEKAAVSNSSESPAGTVQAPGEQGEA